MPRRIVDHSHPCLDPTSVILLSYPGVPELLYTSTPLHPRLYGSGLCFPQQHPLLSSFFFSFLFPFLSFCPSSSSTRFFCSDASLSISFTDGRFACRVAPTTHNWFLKQNTSDVTVSFCFVSRAGDLCVDASARNMSHVCTLLVCTRLSSNTSLYYSWSVRPLCCVRTYVVRFPFPFLFPSTCTSLLHLAIL